MTKSVTLLDNKLLLRAQLLCSSFQTKTKTFARRTRLYWRPWRLAAANIKTFVCGGGISINVQNSVLPVFQVRYHG
jgi:hypothetical protein